MFLKLSFGAYFHEDNVYVWMINIEIQLLIIYIYMYIYNTYNTSFLSISISANWRYDQSPLSTMTWSSSKCWFHRLLVFLGLDVSENRGTPNQIIQFDRVFHYKPSILGYPCFWKHPSQFHTFPSVTMECWDPTKIRQKKNPSVFWTPPKNPSNRLAGLTKLISRILKAASGWEFLKRHIPSKSTRHHLKKTGGSLMFGRWSTKIMGGSETNL